MRLYSILSRLFIAFVTVNGSNLADTGVFESLRTVPQGWHSIGIPDANEKMQFRIALKSPNQALFEQTLMDISNPTSANYGKHMKKAELKRMLRPASTATSAVIIWLKVSGINDADIREDGEWISFIASIGQAEGMLHTNFSLYQNANRKSLTKIRTLHYSLPKELWSVIDMISPTTRFAQIKPERSQIYDSKIVGATGSGLNVTACNSTITPTCLRELYNIKGFTPDPETGGFIGISGFLEQYAQFGDLAQWIPEFAPWAAGGNFTWTSINGGKLLQGASNPNDSTEANLDIQYTVGLTYPMRNNYYSSPGRGPLVPDLDQPTQADNQNEPYLEYFTYLASLDDDDLPHTISTSYGEDEQSVPANYSRVVCNLIGQLGARGTTVIFSSGDTGVGSACQTNDGKNTTRFLPIFPASCPYVTSVGGTLHVEPEAAVGFSSGGFSDRWPRPWWQEKAVSDYLDILGPQWKGLYNPRGRGFPDIAAQGRYYNVVDKGRITRVSGTSASAPTVASIVALLNAARLQAGLPTFGFLNPWLYTKGFDALTDIVRGGSTGCTGRDIYSGLKTPFVPYASWNATKGWDPVTGLGTPDFQKLLKLAAPRYGWLAGRYDRRVQQN
ncbi:tripeptidyl-peptidase-like protein [Tothia fuscella]|uniref:tripeptidyl-peptidase II n=1 Tax=Tothia fuscella TaxID=1048955 RepID=A0A9P4TRF2_9PEZI|nr:tripeptidyl-peptidase-like protein [Tothia fuscella]